VHFYDVQKEDISDILYVQLTSSLLDDLDTPAFLASIQKAVWNINDEVLKVILYIDATVLKVWLYEGVVALVEKPAVVVPDDIKQIAEARRMAKQKKHFGLADELRKELLWKWWVVEDTKEAYVINPL
jgi:cysteinyl-tRNA synthetase